MRAFDERQDRPGASHLLTRASTVWSKTVWIFICDRDSDGISRYSDSISWLYLWSWQYLGQRDASSLENNQEKIIFAIFSMSWKVSLAINLRRSSVNIICIKFSNIRETSCLGSLPFLRTLALTLITRVSSDFLWCHIRVDLLVLCQLKEGSSEVRMYQTKSRHAPFHPNEVDDEWWWYARIKCPDASYVSQGWVIRPPIN